MTNSLHHFTMHADDRAIRRERRLLVLLGVISLGLVGGALYMQFVRGEDPCPLCIIQRYFFVLIAVFAFLGAALKGWRGIAVLETLVALSGHGGIVASARHVYIQAHPGFSCGFDALQPVVDGLPPAAMVAAGFQGRRALRNTVSADLRAIASAVGVGSLCADVPAGGGESLGQAAVAGSVRMLACRDLTDVLAAS